MRSAVWVACARLLHSQRKSEPPTLKTPEVKIRREARVFESVPVKGEGIPMVNGKKWKKKIDMKREGPADKKRLENLNGGETE